MRKTGAAFKGIETTDELTPTRSTNVDDFAELELLLDGRGAHGGIQGRDTCGDGENGDLSAGVFCNNESRSDVATFRNSVVNRLLEGDSDVVKFAHAREFTVVSTEKSESVRSGNEKLSSL